MSPDLLDLYVNLAGIAVTIGMFVWLTFATARITQALGVVARSVETHNGMIAALDRLQVESREADARVFKELRDRAPSRDAFREDVRKQLADIVERLAEIHEELSKEPP